ncbi:DUF1998 domain-containing protein [Pseudomonas aeruginosa]|uniref:DUF1998 domain-containing protein n=1 Tax=Pseudomonas aeruginosa TaxID=287 RepID=UPI000EAD445E|nr:DUF1998 domain-containing protein [Pseudomonas aeruginosa]HCT7101463.1 DUF1998 domain-containing protein [Pseudomonas aeruginosa]HEN8507884.1 DUF1998 domain-containing protein [Pseudomonas aeruginosa]HEN8756307.1 DUF1998 domain-containing protein [Pseudomonas aeruginosa]HEN8806078.1 DUF1998 domain-containing protein [Pseudomonas aeruginosa]
MSNELGELRRSAVVATFGPGAIIDFRADQATISAVAAGLEEWDRSFPPAGLKNEQCIQEPRLQRKLGVHGFRLPPVTDPVRAGKGDGDKRSLVAARFPNWLQCPRCNRIAPQKKWGYEPGKAPRFCGCLAKDGGTGHTFVVPVRFVMACPNGHLDDFPWHWWVGHEKDCSEPNGFLQLDAERPGHAGLILSCPKCHARRSMDGIFSAKTWEKFSYCSGKRPWLAGADQKCHHHPQAVQRGASNLYFPVIESALSIPPWSDRLQEVIGIYWDAIVNVAQDQRIGFVRILAESVLASALDELHVTPEQLVTQIEYRLRQYEQPITDIRQEEYHQLTSGQDSDSTTDREFEIRNIAVPAEIGLWFSRIVKVVRLREVRALKGFTRINPPGDENQGFAALSARPMSWLPAIEVRGEGIFLELNQEFLSKWESEEQWVNERAQKLDLEWKQVWQERYGNDSEPPETVTSRFLLIHTFAHALMRQLTLECGYSSASLRERIYASSGDLPMAGLLIFTATSDADGTLGGLQRQADSARISRTITAAIAAMEWCSSDPLCIQDVFARPSSFLLSACHACVLAPETSCEHFNRFLDRALLIGSVSKPNAGFFSDLLPGRKK